MTKQTNGSQRPHGPPSHLHDARAQKRAEALRQNLARRKGQARERADEQMDETITDKPQKDQ